MKQAIRFPTTVTAMSKWLLVPVLIASLGACSESDEDSGTGYVQLYNAISAAPSLRLEIDDESLGSYVYNDASSQYGLDATTYEFKIEYPTSDSKEQLVSEFEHKISGDDVSLFVVTGDAVQSEVLKFDYEFEDPDTEDEQFTFKLLNLNPELPDIDIYFAEEGSVFAEAELLISSGLFSLSDSFYRDTGTYKFFITAAGSSEVLYESDDSDFLYTNQQVLVVNQNHGAGQSPLSLSLITSAGSVVEMLHKNSDSEVRFYNALVEHELLPEYSGEMDLYINGVDEKAEVTGLQRISVSDFFPVEFGDYPLDITNSNAEALTSTQLVSTMPNASVTKFFYLTEVEIDDDDEDTENEVEIYFNSIELEASTNLSRFQHDIQVLNFSNEYPTVKVYFVGNGETKATTENVLNSNFSFVSETSLYNDDYDVYFVAIDGSSEILLAATTLELGEDSDNYFLVLEEMNNSFEVNVLPQTE